MNKLMLALAVSTTALAAIWAGGAAEADDRFRFADCSVEFTLQDGRFVAVDGRSWAQVDPTGACNDVPSADGESAGGEGDDPPAGAGDGGSDDSRSAPAGSASDETEQQDDSADGAGSADGSFEPTLPADVVEYLARQAQERQDGASAAPLSRETCTDVVKPETGPTLISFQDNRHCVIVWGGGAVQVSRGDYTLNVTLPAFPASDLGWRVYSRVHWFVGTQFTFQVHPGGAGIIRLNAADGAVMNRWGDHICEREWVIVEEIDGHTEWAAVGDIVWCLSPLLDAIVASVTVPASE